MSNDILTDDDLDLSPLQERTVAIVGYGAQGRSHALNLRDSGVEVVIGQRPGRGFDTALADGFEPGPIEQAARLANVISLLLPDEMHQPVFESQIQPHLEPGNIIVTCHGFSLHYKLIAPPWGVAAVLVAPKGAGHRVRSAYLEGSGVPGLVAAGPNADPSTMQLARAYAKGLGCGRAGVLLTTIAEETETDLFGEQVVLCGGVSHLVQAAYQTLVDAGYRPEIAYFECVQELKLVVDLLHQGGLSFMRDHISNTAEYGDYTRGPRIVDPRTRQVMKEILEEIRSGKFAREWIEEANAGGPRLADWRERARNQPMEEVAQRVIAITRSAAGDGS